MKPKLSLLGWMSFSLSVCELVTMSMPRAGLTGLMLGLSSRLLTAALLFFMLLKGA